MVNAQPTAVATEPVSSLPPSSKLMDTSSSRPMSIQSDPSSDAASAEFGTGSGSGSTNGSPADTLVDSQVLDGPGGQGDGVKSASSGPGQAFANGGAGDVGKIAMVVVQLHRFCAEGDVMGVRSILSQNLQLVETIDTTTGWTPMLSAIYANQPDVVRELLLAGAYPPPPSVTSDPVILSILYPQLAHQSAHLVSPAFSVQALSPISSFSGPSPTSPEFSNFGHQPPHHFRMNGHSEARGKGVLPPLDVAKAIPCKNFPNCRFGDSCLFRHPPTQQFFGQQPDFAQHIQGFPQQPFSPNAPVFFGAQPGQPPRSFAMDGQAAVFQPQHQNAPHGRNNLLHPHAPVSPGLPVPVSSVSTTSASDNASPSTTTTPSAAAQDSQPLPATTSASDSGTPTPDATAATLPAVTGEVEGSNDVTATSAPETSHHPVIPGSTAPQSTINGHLPQRQGAYQGQIPFGMNGEYVNGRKPFQAKKMSFSGGKGPNWGLPADRASHMGSWTNGLPPPCVFFQSNKCRNGDMCKFPHVNAEGVDCRHPDIINGTMAPAGANSNLAHAPRPRGRASFGAGFFQHAMGPPHPNFVAMQKAQFAQARSDAVAAPKVAPTTDVDVKKVEESAPVAKDTSASVPKQEQQDAPAAAAAIPRSLSNGNSASKSVPNTRAGSPTRSPAATTRVPRTGRQSHPSANGAAPRSASTAPVVKAVQQKVPIAADFPNLAGASANSGTPTGWAGKMTLAQVLSAPAPVKAVPESAPAADASGVEQAAPSEGKAESGKDEQAKPVAATSEQTVAPPSKPRRKIPSLKNAMDNVKRRTTISAPGKVLITGGYLVLDPKYTGTVLAASSRFYTSIASIELKANTVITPNVGTIIVVSPQFLSAEWTYKVDTSANVNVEQSGSASGSRNKFVELALRETLRLISAFKGKAGVAQVFAGEPRGNFLKITIAGDNDFYSQRQALSNLSLTLVSASLAKLPEFGSLGTTLADVHKTGMGSSAALITSLVAAMLVHLGVVDGAALSNSSNDDNTETSDQELPYKGQQAKDLIHNTAQYVHCLAQGKVGSGFDVSSAVYGSQTYRKFESSAIDHLMVEGGVSASELKISLLPSARWTNSYKPVRLPPGIRLFLADVDAGSDTPSLVGKVLKWRKDNAEEANDLWEHISSRNGHFAELLARLCDRAASNAEDYETALVTFAGSEGSSKSDGLDTDNDIVAALRDLTKTMTEVRASMKRMGELAGVPIEPDEQTKLLDACTALPGVIGGGVPGAGGYDAIQLLIISQESSAHNGYVNAGAILSRVEELFVSWTELSLCPLSCGADAAGGLESHPDPNRVRGLAAVVGAPPYFSVSM